MVAQNKLLVLTQNASKVFHCSIVFSENRWLALYSKWEQSEPPQPSEGFYLISKFPLVQLPVLLLQSVFSISLPLVLMKSRMGGEGSPVAQLMWRAQHASIIRNSVPLLADKYDIIIYDNHPDFQKIQLVINYLGT